MKAEKLILGLVALSILSFAATASAGVPQMINYQGVLTDPSGCPVNDGLYTMIFRIYDAPINGNLRWWELYDTVRTTQGNFNVLLGSVNPIPDSLFLLYPELWLTVKVGNDPEMTPRQRITSVGYAFHSEYTDTAQYAHITGPDDDWIIVGDTIYHLEGNVGIGTTSPGHKLHIVAPDQLGLRVDGPHSGTGSNLVLQTTGIKSHGWEILATGSAAAQGVDKLNIRDLGDASDDLTITADGNVGIGTTSPAYDLDVVDDARVQDDLIVEGTIKLTFDYSSGWFSISEGGTVIKTHGLGGDESKYIVFMDGKSSDGKIHQAAYGITCYRDGVLEKCAGCEKYGLTNSEIKVHRAPDDADEAPNKDWYRCRIRILKNQ